MLPRAKLAVQVNQTNPPVPTGVVVMIGQRMLAVVPMEEFRRVKDQIERMESVLRDY